MGETVASQMKIMEHTRSYAVGRGGTGKSAKGQDD